MSTNHHPFLNPPTDFRNPLWLIASGWVIPAFVLFQSDLQAPANPTEWVLFSLILVAIIVSGAGAWIAFSSEVDPSQANIGHHLFTGGTLFAWSLVAYYIPAGFVPIILAITAGLVAVSLTWTLSQAWPYLLFIIPILIQSLIYGTFGVTFAAAVMIPLAVIYTLFAREWTTAAATKSLQHRYDTLHEQMLTDKLALKNSLNELAIENRSLQAQPQATQPASSVNPNPIYAPLSNAEIRGWATAIEEIGLQTTFANGANALAHFALHFADADWSAIYFKPNESSPFQFAVEQFSSRLSTLPPEYLQSHELERLNLINFEQVDPSIPQRIQITDEVELESISLVITEGYGSQSIVLTLGRVRIGEEDGLTERNIDGAYGLLVSSAGYLFNHQLVIEKDHLRRQDMVLDEVFSEVYKSLTVREVLQSTAEQIGKAVNSPHVQIRVIPDQQ